MSVKGKEDTLRCSFCGKSQDETQKLIAGPNVYICDECIVLCGDLLRDEFELETPKASKQLPVPKDIVAFLNEHVIGQDDAKMRLAVAVYNHYKRVYKGKKDGIRIEKSNVMMLGPTGTGKTHLCKTLAQFLQVPFAIADATSLTEAGYVGEDVENILLKLIHAADHDIELAQRGIIYLDECDKIARKGDSVSITRDVSGEGVQHALLKIIEGTVANVPPQGGRKHPNQEFIQLDTTNILFIVGGAFDGLDKIIQARLNKKSIGFSTATTTAVSTAAQTDDIYKQVKPEDLVRFGLVPEFVGRLPILTTLQRLDHATLRSILTTPKHALIKQYQELLRLDDVRLEFTDDALEAIAEEAISRGTGARGLRSIVEDVMTKVMYEVPSLPSVKQVIIDRSTVLREAPATFIAGLPKKPRRKKTSVPLVDNA